MNQEVILPLPRRWPLLRSLRLAAIVGVLGVLLYLALRNAPLAEIWETLRQLRPWQIGLILVLNAAVVVCFALRWWIVVRADNPGVPFLPLVGYRLSVFALSYFTPGPQVGGEPLQVHYLHRRHGVNFVRAMSSVIMDKLLELLAGFVLLCVGAWSAFRLGLFAELTSPELGAAIPFVALLAWPLVHMLLLYHRRHPLSGMLRFAAPLIGRPRWARLLMVSEHLAAVFTRRRLPWLLASLAFSLLAVAGMALEYYLMASFLSAPLSLAQTLSGLTAALLAFLLPLPGGLGALEASQVLAFAAFGYPAPVAISLALLMRGRDLVNGGLGLLLAGRGLQG